MLEEFVPPLLDDTEAEECFLSDVAFAGDFVERSLFPLASRARASSSNFDSRLVLK